MACLPAPAEELSTIIPTPIPTIIMSTRTRYEREFMDAGRLVGSLNRLPALSCSVEMECLCLLNLVNEHFTD